MNINIRGAAFHVGSASNDPLVFKDAIDYSKDVFEYAKEKGFIMDILDVGGGFTRDNFQSCASVIKIALGDRFKGVKLIAEPGRFLAEETFTFFIPVIGKRHRDGVNEYWIADGLYGSFNCILYDEQVPTLKKLDGEEEVEESVVWFITCDSTDRFGRCKLPPMEVGDFLMVENFGAYTIAGAMDFNGINMSNPLIFYIP
jgi:ornithine decarboxylase